jgi:hypothetical protein
MSTHRRRRNTHMAQRSNKVVQGRQEEEYRENKNSTIYTCRQHGTGRNHIQDVTGKSIIK